MITSVLKNIQFFNTSNLAVSACFLERVARYFKKQIVSQATLTKFFSYLTQQSHNNSGIKSGCFSCHRTESSRTSFLLILYLLTI